jgi:hypothetical protein
MTMDLGELCDRAGCDRQAALELLAEAHATQSGIGLPWHARALIGLTAWITALVTVTLGIAVLYAGLGVDPLRGVPLTSLGALFLGSGLWGLGRHADRGVFVEQASTALAAAGLAMISAGVGLATEELWVAALAAVVLLGLVVETGPGTVLQFLAAALALALVLLTLVLERVPYFLDLASLTVPLGLFLLLHPPRIDLRPTAVVLLLGLPLLELASAWTGAADAIRPGGWGARIMCIAGFVAVIALLRRHTRSPIGRRNYLLVGGGGIVLGALLPPGGSATLAILLAAYALGSPGLSVVGALLFVAFLWELYYDLQMTLLGKSLVLMSSGLVLLGLWWLAGRSRAGENAR